MTNQSGTEVSKKIRAAIKAKLLEIGAYVDEELPDYIMVMIANKKTKEQMKTDLQLFLGKNAIKFVEWLFDIFDRLQAVSKPEKESKDERSKSASKDKKDRDSRTERDDKKDRRTKEKEREKEKEKEREREKVKEVKEMLSHHKSSKEKLRSSRMPETVSSSEKRAMHYDRSKEYKSRETKHAAFVEEDIDADLEMHVEPIGGSKKFALSQRKIDAIDAEISEADAKAKEQRLKDERQQRSKDHRRVRTPPRSPSHHSKRSVGRVQPIRHEPPPPQEEKSRHQRTTLMPVSSVVRVASQSSSAAQKAETRRPPPAEKAPRPSLFLKAMHDASVSSALRPLTSSKEKDNEKDKRTVRKRHKEESPGVEESPVLSLPQQKKLRREVKEQPKTTFDEIRRHPREHAGGSKRKVEVKYDEDEEAGVLVVDEESVKKPEAKTRFVITMNGVSDFFHKRFGVPPPEEALGKVEKVEENPPPPSRTSLKPLSGLSISSKPTIIRRVPEQISKRPIQQRMVHRQEQEDIRVEEEPEDEPMTAEIYRQERNGTTNKQMQQPVEFSDTRNVVKASDSGDIPKWPGQIIKPVSITIEDDDEEEEEMEEAEIDAGMSSSASGSYVSGTFDTTEAPTTDNLTRPSPALPADKILERCRFWPTCRQGDACTYLHPSQLCLTFPKCTFGEKCLYIHPNCKFDQSCTRPNCPFTHTSKKAIGGPAMPPARPYVTKIVQDFNTIPCKFAGKCTNIRCPYKHPKPCRFAAECLNPTCPFAHPKKREEASAGAVSAKYKWKADSSSTDQEPRVNTVSSVAA